MRPKVKHKHADAAPPSYYSRLLLVQWLWGRLTVWDVVVGDVIHVL